MLVQQCSQEPLWLQFFPVSVYDYIEGVSLNIAEEDFELRRLFRAGLDCKTTLPEVVDQVLECIRENYMPNTPHWPQGWEDVIPGLVETFVDEVITDWQTYGCPPETEEEQAYADDSN